MDHSISKGNLIFTILEIIDLINPAITEDLIKTSYLVWKTTEALGFSQDIQSETVAACLVSGIGCIKKEVPEEATLYEIFYTSLEDTKHILSQYQPFRSYTSLYETEPQKDITLKNIISNAIKVIDHTHQTSIISVTSLREIGIPKKLASHFLTLLQQESIRDTLDSPLIEQLLYNTIQWVRTPFTSSHLEKFSLFLLSLLYIKKPSIAIHSYISGEISQLMAKNEHIPAYQQLLIKLSGYLQHVGKIGIPNHILEKGAPLSVHDKALLHNSPYFTFKLLQHIDSYKEIIIWASFDHRVSDSPKRKATTLEIDIIHLCDVYVTLRNIHQGSDGGIDEVIRQLQKKADTELNQTLIYALKRQLGKLELLRQSAQEKAPALLSFNS